MIAFIISSQDRPGELAKIAEAIGERGINITSIACIAWSGAGAVALTTNDEGATRTALAAKGYEIREVELVPASIEDRPGTLAQTVRKLADAGINIELLLPMGMREGKVTVAMATSDNTQARQLIGEAATVGA